MKLSKSYIFLLLVLLTTEIGCSDLNLFGKKKIKEGVILYNITYLEESKDNPLIALLPTSMNMLFKSNNSVVKIEGFMGLFSFYYITLNHECFNSTVLRIFDKTYEYKIDCGKPAFGYQNMGELSITKLEETVNIAGLDCKRAKITIKGEKTLEFFVAYTDIIDIDKPNQNNPFIGIDGVLMEFQVNLNGIGMKFTAQSVTESPVSDEEFKLPQNCNAVDFKKMEELMGSFSSKPK